MDNETLIDIVRHELPPNQSDEEVLKVLERVDRINFVPDIEMDLSLAPIWDIDALVKASHEAFIRTEDKDYQELHKDLLYKKKIVKNLHKERLRIRVDVRKGHKFTSYTKEFNDFLNSFYKSNGNENLWENILKNHPRRIPLPISLKRLAYLNIPLPIGEGQTISQPSMVAWLAASLGLEGGERVRELGTGSGYQAAVTAEIIGDKGFLVSYEMLESFAKLGEENLRRHLGNNYDSRVKVILGDGSVPQGNEGNYDAVYLTAGVSPTFEPEILGALLKPEGGTLVFPHKEGDLVKQSYKNKNPKYPEPLGYCKFVPLVGKNA